MAAELPTETSPEALTGADAAAGQAGRPRFTRSTWVAILCSVACLGVMAAVIVLANNVEEERDRGRHGALPGDPFGTGPAGRAGGDPARRAAALGGCGPLDPDKPPELELEIENGLVDFGKLRQGVTVTRDVRFKSVGKGPLCIGKVTTGCGCLKASLVGEKRRFDPGESGSIRLVADTTGQIGVVRKQPSILCNDIKSPRRSFRVVMDVSAGLLHDPRYLQFGNVAPNTPATRTLTLSSDPADKDWKVLGIESTRRIAGRPKVTYEFEAQPLKDPRLRKLMLRITHPGYKELGAIRDVIAITTDHPDRKRIELPAHIHVVPRIRSKSRTISLGFVQVGVPLGATRARLESPIPGVSFEVEKVEVVPPEGADAGPAGPGFTATFGKDPRGWWVDVKYDGKSRSPGLLRARLRVHTDDEQQPILHVPIRATVRGPR